MAFVRRWERCFRTRLSIGNYLSKRRVVPNEIVLSPYNRPSASFEHPDFNSDHFSPVSSPYNAIQPPMRDVTGD